MNMQEAAEQWVSAHRVSCTNSDCGCAQGDGGEMVDALVARWLGLEDNPS